MLRVRLLGARLVTRRMSVKAEQESKTVLDTKAQDFEAIQKETYQKVGKMVDRISSIIVPVFTIWCGSAEMEFAVAVLK